MGNCGPPRNQTKYIVRKVLMRAITFIEFEPLCQKLWAFRSSFTMTTHQISSCHETPATYFENFYFLPNSVLNFTKFGGKLAQEQKVTGKKQNSRWKIPPPPPSAYRVN